jgi:hypothetical protein
MGLLDDFSQFVKTPEGMGLLSAVAGGLAGARRGTPFNNMGRAGLAGVMGYGSALDRQEKTAENAVQNQLRQEQMAEFVRKKKIAEEQQAWLQNNPNVPEEVKAGVVPVEKWWERQNPKVEPYTLTPGSKRYGVDNSVVAEAPIDKKMGTEMVPIQGGMQQMYQTINGVPDITKPIGAPRPIFKSSPDTVVNVGSEKQATEFEKELGKGQAKGVLESKQSAEDAASIMDTVQIGKKLLDKGMITGFGADALKSFGSALNSVGVTFASDPVANTEAYGAAMAQNVAKIIKQFGAGTGLSDADREYAQKMAGGQVTLTEKSLRKILEINEKLAVNVVNRHNKRVAGIKTNIPLEVTLPEIKPDVVNQIPGAIGAPPPGAVRRKGG